MLLVLQMEGMQCHKNDAHSSVLFNVLNLLFFQMAYCHSDNRYQYWRDNLLFRWGI